MKKKNLTLIFILVAGTICIVSSVLYTKWVWESSLPEWLKLWLLMPNK